MFFVCQTFFPDYQATSQLFSDLLFELARRGHRTRVICGWPLAAPGVMAEGLPKRERVRQLHICRAGWRVDFKKNLLFRCLGYLSYFGGTVWHLLLDKDPSLVVGCTNPPMMPWLIWLVSSVRRRPYVLFLLDLYPEGLTAMGKIKQGGWVDQLWTLLNRRAFRRASRILVLGRDMQDLVQRRYACISGQLRYVPHWSQNEDPSPASPETTKLWARLELGQCFVVQYSGNMGLWHDLESLVRAAQRLSDRPGIRFLFIGDGRRKQAAQALARQLGVGNILWLPYQPKETLSDTLACCHLALISQRDGLQGVAVPCKLYGVLASGRAIIGLVPANSEAAMVIREEICGLVLKPDDDAGLAAAILDWAGKPEMVRAMGERSLRAYQEKYTLKQAVERFELVLSEVR